MEYLNVTNRYFITGTDTDIGKTVASVALLQAIKKEGWLAVGYKPVASGAEMTANGLQNSDVLALQRNSSLALPYALVNSYTFFEGTAPHIVSVNEKRPIEFFILTEGLRQLETRAEFVIIEGAGGWFTPLTPTKTFADWVIEQELSVILVVGIRLGCINHAILTAQAISHAGLELAGWIANIVSVDNRRQIEYLFTLQKILNPTPFLGKIPWLTAWEENGWRYLDISVLRFTVPG